MSRHAHDYVGEALASGTADADPDRYSEDALATRFTRQRASDLRYVAPWARWLWWDGCRWQIENTLRAYDAARAICRAAAQEVRGKSKPLADKIASASTVAAVERLARADRTHAATVVQWDADPWLLTTPAGTVDLRTGKMRRPRQEDYITMSTSIAPGGDCPRWRVFLERITDGDAELQAYLQRMAGYALTGSTREHALFFCYGTGGNGKTTFLDPIIKILADYHRTAPIESFTASSQDRHPTELAMLRGARLVTAVETEEGRGWAESKIKMLTGGDRVAARFMKQDFFEFAPQFKLVISGNHKPGLRSVDEAVRRRLHLVPFTITIPANECDPDFPQKLAAEHAGILAWAIEGCLKWQRIGLARPPAIKAATDSYLADEDTLAIWLADCCETSPHYEAPTGSLFGSWLLWCEKAGERPGNQKTFVQALEANHFERAKVGPRDDRKRGFRGLRLRQVAWRADEDAA